MRLEFTLDCCDLDQMAEFWQAAVGFVVVGGIEGRYVSLSGHSVTLTLQRVREPKTVKNRMHLDLLVGNLEPEVHRLERLGASRFTPTACQEFGQTWFMMADPEGNEFCVAQEQRQPVSGSRHYRGIAPGAGVTVRRAARDAADTPGGRIEGGGRPPEDGSR